MPGVEAIRWDGQQLLLLDQRALPSRVSWRTMTTSSEVAGAIRDMVVRGAPAIGIAAAYGLALAEAAGTNLAVAAAELKAARPTAVNLAWAVERALAAPAGSRAAFAVALHEEDASINRALGDVGAALLPTDPVVYHHCNTGALATGGWGTALGIVRSVVARGGRPKVWVGETRPWLQGARLTAWECAAEGVEATLLVDSAAASVLTMCDAVLVGADRVARNGDVANKVGTLALAILARHYGVPFYVAMPWSTYDPETPDGRAIVVEERDPSEVTGWGGATWAAEIPVYNPAFDVTPASLVTAWITQTGAYAGDLVRHHRSAAPLGVPSRAR
jgi:methylthioribose-1-phosphate isomerase